MASSPKSTPVEQFACVRKKGAFLTLTPTKATAEVFDMDGSNAEDSRRVAPYAVSVTWLSPRNAIYVGIRVARQGAAYHIHVKHASGTVAVPALRRGTVGRVPSRTRI